MTPYIFIHINKCAGTSIKQALNQPRNKYQSYKHERISDVKSRMPEEEFKSTFKFAFIRNPYDRIQSMYRYRKYNLKRVKLQNMSFEEWFWKAFTTNFTAVPLMNEPCWSYISDNGKLAVDFVGRVENIEQDWVNLCRILGKDIDLPRVNTSPVYGLRYSDSMKQLVEDIFHKDLELYGHRIPA